MAVAITLLSENTAGRGGLLAEWGISCLVETDDAVILFDTGQGEAIVPNADALDCDFGVVDSIVLSHGHFDHTGGLRPVLRRLGRRVEVIAHPDIWDAKYSRDSGGGMHYIGIPHTLEELENLGADFRFSREPVPLSDDIITSGEIPLATAYENVGSSFFVKTGSDYRPDDILDDLALIVKTAAGLVIILGCGHRGIINTIYHAREITGIATVHTVVGGSHLIAAGEDRLWWTVNALREMDVAQLALCHCTGFTAACTLAGEFGERFLPVTAGSRINIP